MDTSPLQTGHQVRGIGSYTKKLLEELKKEKWGIELATFNSPAAPPPADITHYPYFDLFFHTLPIKKAQKRVVTIHDVIPLVFPKHFPVGIRGTFNLLLQKQALKKTDFIICDSKTSKDDVAEKLSYPKEKIKVIYLAPSEIFKEEKNKEKLNRVAAKYSLPKEFVLYVGDVNWNKNLKSLLEAVKISKVDLVLVGKSLKDLNIPQSKAIEEIITGCDLTKTVHRLGFVEEEDLAAIYNLASLTVLPSHYEGFGLPVLESMACGTPVVCSNVASLSEISGDAAIFCDPNNPEDVSKQISYILKMSPKEQQNLSQKSIKHASAFSWHKVAKETIEVYKSLQ